MIHEEIDARSIAPHAELLIVALEEALIDRVADRLHGGVKLPPIMGVERKILHHTLVKQAVHALPLRVIRPVQRVAQMHIRKQTGRITVIRVAVI